MTYEGSEEQTLDLLHPERAARVRDLAEVEFERRYGYAPRFGRDNAGLADGVLLDDIRRDLDARAEAHAARKAAVDALNEGRSEDTPKVINRAGWVHEPGRDGWIGVRNWYCVGGQGARGHELGQRVTDAEGVDDTLVRRADRDGDLLATERLVGVLRQRLAYGARRTSPSESAIRLAKENGWSAPYPLADLFERERELRAAGLEA